MSQARKAPAQGARPTPRPVFARTLVTAHLLNLKKFLVNVLHQNNGASQKRRGCEILETRNVYYRKAKGFPGTRAEGSPRVTAEPQA